MISVSVDQRTQVAASGFSFLCSKHLFKKNNGKINAGFPPGNTASTSMKRNAILPFRKKGGLLLHSQNISDLPVNFSILVRLNYSERVANDCPVDRFASVAFLSRK